MSIAWAGPVPTLVGAAATSDDTNAALTGRRPSGLATVALAMAVLLLLPAAAASCCRCWRWCAAG
jgi:hypothetical protein